MPLKCHGLEDWAWLFSKLLTRERITKDNQPQIEEEICAWHPWAKTGSSFEVLDSTPVELRLSRASLFTGVHVAIGHRCGQGANKLSSEFSPVRRGGDAAQLRVVFDHLLHQHGR